MTLNPRRQLVLEGAQIGFRNFEGKEGEYNREGDRSFVVFLDTPLADELAAEGWNIKYPKPNSNIPEGEDDRKPYLNVAVRFDNFPPKVIMVDSANGKETALTDTSVGLLDSTELQFSDLIISPSVYTVQGRTGVKAYLKTGYFNIVPDVFASKYNS